MFRSIPHWEIRSDSNEERGKRIMDKAELVKELMRLAEKIQDSEVDENVKERTASRYPPKAVDYNKVEDPDAFWEMNIKDAERKYALRLNPETMGDLIFFLNMVASSL